VATLPSEYRYWAFVSYSSKDKAWGRWLHRAIESYGIPAQLVSHPTPAGHPAPKRFQPLFRDRDELPASADLGAQIEEALRASRYLIVVCSRHAAQSKWVNKEIETFQRFDRHGLILAVIVDGEPNAGDERECFPTALRECEPIAADARPQGDGKANAKLKLLAGMLGVSFDALKQRDMHRRFRRLQLAVSAALLVALSLAGLAAYAFHQRNKAVHARQQAESVLEFLLYDLRAALSEVGRLNIAEKCQSRVDQYYLEMGTERPLPTTSRNQASSREFEGDLAFARGDFAGALKAFQESFAIFERIAAEDPTDPNGQRNLIVARRNLGKTLWANGDTQGALGQFRASFAISDRLAANHPTNVLSQRDLCKTHEDVGTLLLQQGNATGALEELRASLAIADRLAAQDPTNPVWLGDQSACHAEMASALLAQGDPEAALKEGRISLDIAEHLQTNDPTHSGVQRCLADSHDRIGDVLLAQKDTKGALAEFQASLAICGRLTAQDRTNAIWQHDLCVAHGRVGDAMLKLGDADGASREYRSCIPIAERLATQNPANASWTHDLCVAYCRLGLLSKMSGNATEAMSWQRKAYDRLSDIKKRGVRLYANDEEVLKQLRAQVGD